MKKLGQTYPTALVTGGTSGLGLAFCEMLVAEEVKTFSASRNPGKLPDLPELHGLQVDLTDLAAVSAWTKDFIEEHGAPDLLINNAGHGAFFEWDQFPVEEIARQLDLMLHAPTLLCRAFAPFMAERGSGGIVNVSSLAVQYPLPHLPLYNAAKAGISALSTSLMLEYDKGAPFVIDFRPGDFRTPFNEVASCLEDRATDRASRVWSGMKKRLEEAPAPVMAAHKLLKALRRRKSSVVYAGGFIQAKLGPLLHRIAPSRWLRSFIRSYHGFR